MNPKNLFVAIAVALTTLLMATPQSVEAQCSTKVDLGAAYVHLDNLTSGVTTHSADLAALRADVNFKLFQGLIVKPTVLYGASNPFHVESDDALFAATISIGHCIPITEKFLVQPNIGWTYTKMKTVFNGTVTELLSPVGPVEAHFHGIKQSFTSNGPSVGLEGYYFFSSRFRLCLSVQYIWSKTDAELHGIYSDKSHTKGPSYSGMLEYDINDCWSVNIAGAYNISLTKRSTAFVLRVQK